MAQNKIKISMLAAALALSVTPYAYGGGKPDTGKRHAVEGEKLDSGLGKLPHYRHWAKHPATKGLVVIANRVPGEKLDSGLGDLPPYREWAGFAGSQHIAVVESAGSR